MSLFERLQKPFLTVETGEAYQPVRISYEVAAKDKLLDILNQLQCCEKKSNGTSWEWFWKAECKDLHFESLDSFKINEAHPPRLATFSLRDNYLYLSLPSFKRACLAVPFFHRLFDGAAKADHADFINKVFGTDERLPHGFTELFKDDELDKIIQQRVLDYEKMQEQCENATSPEEALSMLAKYNETELHKKLPYAERYEFQYEMKEKEETKPIELDVIFLGFYIFLRGRELVAIRRWFGNANYTLADASEETIETVFGGMDIDIIE